MGSTADGLAGKIKNKKASIGIVGMGYVGIPLGLEFARNGFTVTGFDKDSNRVEDINAGKQVLKHMPASAMREFVKKNEGSSTSEFSKLRDMDCLIICVPTPLDEHKQPDMSYIESASEMISKYLQRGQLIILESTTYPGTTDELLKNDSLSKRHPSENAGKVPHLLSPLNLELPSRRTVAVTKYFWANL